MPHTVTVSHGFAPHSRDLRFTQSLAPEVARSGSYARLDQRDSGPESHPHPLRRYACVPRPRALPCSVCGGYVPFGRRSLILACERARARSPPRAARGEPPLKARRAIAPLALGRRIRGVVGRVGGGRASAFREPSLLIAPRPPKRKDMCTRFSLFFPQFARRTPWAARPGCSERHAAAAANTVSAPPSAAPSRDAACAASGAGARGPRPF